jgi:hypothetical protein
MVYTLTNEEKVAIVEQHLKSLEYSKFNLSISLIEESSITSVKQDIVDDLEKQLVDIDAKIESLTAELATLN